MIHDFNNWPKKCSVQKGFSESLQMRFTLSNQDLDPWLDAMQVTFEKIMLEKWG